MRHLITFSLLLFPCAIAAQSAVSISPGMNRAQVVAALGEPATARSAGDHAYLFYRNGCGKACGMNDLVILRRDSVVDAIFRSGERKYTGSSTSPAPVSPTAAAARTRRAAPLKVRPVPPTSPTPSTEMNTPATPRPVMKPAGATDVRPSMPAGEPTVKSGPPAAPAPATKKPAP